MEDTAFQSNLLCRWEEVRKTVLSESNLDHWIDSIASLTAEARTRHFQRWPVLGQYVWPNPQPIPATYDEEISVLKNWLGDRLQWIDNNLPQTGRCGSQLPPSNGPVTLSVIPNPATSFVKVNITVDQPQEAQVIIVAADGKKMFTTKRQLTKGLNNISCNTFNWPKGAYFLKVFFADGSSKSITIIK
jgi:hypothetical protein